MAHPPVIPGKLYGAIAQGRGPNGVRLISANGASTIQRRASTAPSRTSKWIVQVMMILTSAFAFVDVYLLLSSVHHWWIQCPGKTGSGGGVQVGSRISGASMGAFAALQEVSPWWSLRCPWVNWFGPKCRSATV